MNLVLPKQRICHCQRAILQSWYPSGSGFTEGAGMKGSVMELCSFHARTKHVELYGLFFIRIREYAALIYVHTKDLSLAGKLQLKLSWI